MGELSDFAEADRHNFTESLSALESFHAGAVEIMEAPAALFHELAQMFTNASGLVEGERDVNEWLQSRPGLSLDLDLVRQLEEAVLVGPIDPTEPIARAKRGLLRATAALARMWLLLRVRRDYMFGLSDLLCLRVTPAIGYLRLQSESVGLLALFRTDHKLAAKWIKPNEGTTREFYGELQPRLKAKLHDFDLVNYYDQGSQWALHSRVIGIAGGIGSAPKTAERSTGLSYQEVGKLDELVKWTLYYLKAHSKFIGVMLSETPEVSTREDLEKQRREFDARLAAWNARLVAVTR